MSMSVVTDQVQTRRPGDKRAVVRTSVALPILIGFEGIRHSALLHNLSPAGAMIETVAPLAESARIEFHCGSIAVRGTVIWQKRYVFGLKFDLSVSEQQLGEQFARSAAATRWRDGYDLMRLVEDSRVVVRMPGADATARHNLIEPCGGQ